MRFSRRDPALGSIDSLMCGRRCGHCLVDPGMGTVDVLDDVARGADLGFLERFGARGQELNGGRDLVGRAEAGLGSVHASFEISDRGFDRNGGRGGRTAP